MSGLAERQAVEHTVRGMMLGKCRVTVMEKESDQDGARSLAVYPTPPIYVG